MKKESLYIKNFIETHMHLDMIKREPEDVLRDALKQGVFKFISIGVDLASNKKNLCYAAKFKNIYTAVGIHPHETSKIGDKEFSQIEGMLSCGNSKIVAIGEIGLDYHYMHSPKKNQIEVFRNQIDLAKRYNLPIIIHDRDAHEDTMKILSEMAQGMKVVLHCFSGDHDMAQWCLRQGFYFGIGGVVTFKNAQRLSQIVKEIPVDHILLETDAPFLTPVPFRGTPNEPKYIPLIAQRIADLKGETLSQVAEVTTKNTCQFFSF